MKRLYLLRHGTADPRPADGSDSPDRQLVDKGRAQAERVGRLLGELGARVAVVVSSPYARARQTAEAALDALGQTTELRIDERLVPEASVVAATAAIVAAADGLDDRACVLVVGHEPLLSELAASLVGAPGLDLQLRKGGLIEIDVLPGRKLGGTLLGLVRPAHLRAST